MDPDGLEIVRCIETALAKATVRVEEIGYINYHGTSTQLNDASSRAACARSSAVMPTQSPARPPSR
jgi:3-oxoacyl-(acyl-carrier-protein) synthase